MKKPILAAFALLVGLVLPPEVDIGGEWRGEMLGVIQDQGNTQHNDIALTLEQVGDQVSGFFVFLDVQPSLKVPLEGMVSERKFTFTAETEVKGGDYGFTSNCRVYVEASLMVAVTGQRMSGEKRLETCDGTAIGTMSVARPGSD